MLAVLIAWAGTAAAVEQNDGPSFSLPMGALDAGFLKVRAVAKSAAPASPAAQARGLVKRELAASAVPESYVDAAFDDRRSRRYADIPDKFLNWGRPGALQTYDDYRRKFIVPSNINAGVRFARDHKDVLDAVETRYGVDGVLLVALVSRETNYGTFCGSYQVFDALNTIIQEVPIRSAWAVKEEAEFLKMAYSEKLDVHAVLGTYDGGMGFVQFEPSSFNVFAVDFDGDGKKHLDEWPDALGSAANYLKRAGYDKTAAFTPNSPIGRSLFSYNHSDNYVRVILELRGEIAKRL
jgi:membrane-bound lytic murein transglycosylase B